VGLQRAIKKFTPDRECSLATYASHWIMLTITRSLTTKGHLIRLPVHAQALLYQITQAEERPSEKLHRTPTDEELAESMGLDIMKMRTLQQTWKPAIRLDADSFAESEWHELIPDPSTVYDPVVEEKREKIERLRKLFANQDVLESDERAILCGRLGLDTGEPQTLDSLGERFGVIRERIRQIETRCLLRLRKCLKQSDSELVEDLEKCRGRSSSRRRRKLIDRPPPTVKSGWLAEENSAMLDQA
jgi:RNA polymerase primary sigma factor